MSGLVRPNAGLWLHKEKVFVEKFFVSTKYKRE